MADDKEKAYKQTVRNLSKLDYWDEKRVREIVREEIKRDNGSSAMGWVVTLVVWWLLALTILYVPPEFLEAISKLLRGE